MFKIDSTNKITMVRGDTAIFTVSLQDYYLSEGDQIKFTVKRSANDSKESISKIVTEFTDGKAIIELLEEDTKSLSSGSYIYEIECRLKDGRIDTIITGVSFMLIADLG